MTAITCLPCQHKRLSSGEQMDEDHMVTPFSLVDGLFFVLSLKETSPESGVTACSANRGGFLMPVRKSTFALSLRLLVGDIGWRPKDYVLRQLLNKYDPEIIEYAIEDVAGKLSTGYLFKGGGWLPYLYAVARNMAEGD
jgi:hypothetical protein